MFSRDLAKTLKRYSEVYVIMEEKINLNVVIREEKEGGRTIFIVSNEEMGIADFGDTLDEAIENFRKSANLYLETYPEKKTAIIQEEST